MAFRPPCLPLMRRIHAVATIHQVRIWTAKYGLGTSLLSYWCLEEEAEALR